MESQIQPSLLDKKIDDSLIDTFLNDLWSLYFHDPYDDNWNYQSYVKISDVSDIAEFWACQHYLGHKLEAGMFFIMREHIFPCWDDKENIKGGCLSIKILKSNFLQYWTELCILVLGETLVKPEVKNKLIVNGLSCSPKKSFCIIKIWLGDESAIDPKMYNIPSGHYGDIIYRSNMTSMSTTGPPTSHTRKEQ